MHHQNLPKFFLFSFVFFVVLSFPPTSYAYWSGDGSVISTVEINDNTTNGPTLSDSDSYGLSVANIGDLSGDGVNDIAVGAYLDDAGGTDRGAVHIHFLNTDGSVKSTVEINDLTPNGPTLLNSDWYGYSVANIGDLDGDGVNDIAVGARDDDAGGTNRGAVHIHFMNTDGSVKSTVEINSNTVNAPTLTNADRYGTAVAGMGDLDGDTVNDIVVGAMYDDAGGLNRGTVHIHFMNANGSVKSTVEINSTTANGPILTDSDSYGCSVANIGDLNKDGVDDIVVGAARDDTYGTDRGTMHIHFMNTDGSVKSTVEINDLTANGPVLSNGDFLGTSVAGVGDLNGDGVNDIAVGAYGDDAGGTDRGTMYINFMKTDGSIKSTVEINSSTANGPLLSDSDYYGSAVTNLGDLNGDGINDIAVGAFMDDAGGTNRGTVHIHFMYGVWIAPDNTFKEDRKCRFNKSPETTWIVLEPSERDGVSGLNLTWTQVDADRITISIDDGTGNYPWKIDKTSNDGHEFLPNVSSWQNIKLKPINHCKSGDYGQEVSYSKYPGGWYNVD